MRHESNCNCSCNGHKPRFWWLIQKFVPIRKWTESVKKNFWLNGSMRRMA